MLEPAIVTPAPVVALDDTPPDALEQHDLFEPTEITPPRRRRVRPTPQPTVVQQLSLW
jgi:hypothetical protein